MKTGFIIPWEIDIKINMRNIINQLGGHQFSTLKVKLSDLIRPKVVSKQKQLIPKRREKKIK